MGFLLRGFIEFYVLLTYLLQGFIILCDIIYWFVLLFTLYFKAALGPPYLEVKGEVKI